MPPERPSVALEETSRNIAASDASPQWSATKGASRRSAPTLRLRARLAAASARFCASAWPELGRPDAPASPGSSLIADSNLAFGRPYPLYARLRFRAAPQGGLLALAAPIRQAPAR